MVAPALRVPVSTLFVLTLREPRVAAPVTAREDRVVAPPVVAPTSWVLPLTLREARVAGPLVVNPAREVGPVTCNKIKQSEDSYNGS